MVSIYECLEVSAFMASFKFIFLLAPWGYG